MRNTSGLIWGLCFWIAAGWGVGPLKADAPTTDSSVPVGFAFRVDLREPSFLDQPDGSSKVVIEGFGAVERRPGAPNIPYKTYLIAIPPDADPRLEYVVRGSLRVHDRRPSPVPRLRLDSGKVDHDRLARSDDDPQERFKVLAEATVEVLEPDPALYAAAGVDTPWVWLGKPGTMRSQRYVPVYVRGARWDGERELIEVPGGFDVRVAFDTSEHDSGEAAPVDPHFEGVYRQHILNYDQGRMFRIESTHETSSGFSPAGASMMGAGSTPRHKLRVTQNGPLRLDFALLDAAGFTAHAIDTWRLENRGEQVPLAVNDDGDGILESGEWVEFYGQALDDEPDTVLNTDFPGTPFDLFEDRDFTDENIYFLSVDASGQAAMSEDPSAPQFVLTPPAMVTATVHEEIDSAYRPLGGADPWYWLPTLIATGVGNRVDTVALPGLHDPTLPLQVRVNVRGISDVSAVDPDHQTQVTLLNQADQVLAADPGSFDGRTLYLHDFGWTYAGIAASDPVKVRLDAFDIGGGERNDVILDWIEVDYQRSFLADNDRFDFSWPDGDEEFSVDGFSQSAVEVWEITAQSAAGVIQPVRLSGVQVAASGPGTFSARFLMDNDAGLVDGTPRRFVAFAAGSVPLLAGADFPVDTVSDLRDNMIQADLIVIAHEDVLDDSPGMPLDNLLAHRATPAGGNLTSRVVRLEDLQDEFNFGLAGPQGIREFIRWVLSTQPGEGWAAPKPSFVMLVGDGSFDYKGGAAQGNLVPTQIMFKDFIELGYYASDNLLAAVVGDDQLADLVIGRLPARTLHEANDYLQKVLMYETMAPTGAWTKHALTVSDRGKNNDVNEALVFEATNALGIAEIGAEPYTQRQLRYYSDFILPGVPNAPNAMRQAIKDAVNGLDAFEGAALLQFSGHGNFVVWSDDAFLDERFPPNLDTADMTNGLKLPWVIVHNCLSGGFHTTAFLTVGENWLRQNGGGGMGVFAPSGLSFSYIGVPVTEWIWGSLFGPEKRRDVAGPVMSTLAGLCAQNSIEACQQYVLIGDPAARLQLFAVDPATDVSATGSNLEVQLDWTASATAGAQYRILRSVNPAPPYVEIASGVTGTTFTDTAVQNTETYYYVVIAVDPEGFESRYSNFNSDCATSGPDCVKATPLNPDPPSMPTGFRIIDPGIGDRLFFTWNQNPEVDLDFYTVRWGLGSNNPTDAGQTSVLSFAATGLIPGELYCATLSATNTSGNTSADTTEVCDFPVSAPGVRIPDFIDDLQVARNGANVMLTWSEVTDDAYGKPANIVNYEILRGTAPDYTNGGLVKIADCAAPCSSYEDTGAVTGPEVQYRVRAVNEVGRKGTLGSEAPMGVILTVDRAAVAGDVRLTWSAAAVTLDGNPVDLGHYAIYASDAPFSKEDVLDGVLTPLTTLTDTTVDLTPASARRFYSVWVVDTRGNMSPD